jgi:hypothetical protein
MPFEYEGYVLHRREVELKGGRRQAIYFFAKKGNTPKSGEPADKPDGYEVGKNPRTGLPYLKKSG